MKTDGLTIKKNAPYEKVRFNFYGLEFSAGLVGHIINRCFDFVITQACVTAFGRHGVKAFERVFVQGIFTLFDTRGPLVFLAYAWSTGDGTTVTHFTVGFKNGFTVHFGRRSICFFCRLGFGRSGRFCISC